MKRGRLGGADGPGHGPGSRRPGLYGRPPAGWWPV